MKCWQLGNFSLIFVIILCGCAPKKIDWVEQHCRLSYEEAHPDNYHSSRLRDVSLVATFVRVGIHYSELEPIATALEQRVRAQTWIEGIDTQEMVEDAIQDVVDRLHKRHETHKYKEDHVTIATTNLNLINNCKLPLELKKFRATIKHMSSWEGPPDNSRFNKLEDMWDARIWKTVGIHSSELEPIATALEQRLQAQTLDELQLADSIVKDAIQSVIDIHQKRETIHNLTQFDNATGSLRSLNNYKLPIELKIFRGTIQRLRSWEQ